MSKIVQELIANIKTREGKLKIINGDISYIDTQINELKYERSFLEKQRLSESETLMEQLSNTSIPAKCGDIIEELKNIHKEDNVEISTSTNVSMPKLIGSFERLVSQYDSYNISPQLLITVEGTSKNGSQIEYSIPGNLPKKATLLSDGKTIEEKFKMEVINIPKYISTASSRVGLSIDNPEDIIVNVPADKIYKLGNELNIDFLDAMKNIELDKDSEDVME